TLEPLLHKPFLPAPNAPRCSPVGGFPLLEAMRAAFDYSLTAQPRLSRSSRLGTHTRSIQAHFREAQSSPPRPSWFYIADMESRSSKGLSRTRPLALGFESPTPPVTTKSQ